MSRRLSLAGIFAAFAAFAVMQFEPTQLVALQKVKQKGKNKKPSAPVAGEKEDESKVVFAFDPGSHTRPISALGFNKDQSKLITVGWDYTIQIWSSKTGERLDILRLPAYGRDNGFDSNRWNHAVVSSDGNTVAIGGGPKLLYGDKDVPTRLLIVDVANKRVRKLNLPADPKSPVTCLSFSTDANRLAVGFGGTDKSVYILEDVQQILKNSAEEKFPTEPALVVKTMAKEPDNLALSPSGNKLVVQANHGSVASFDVQGTAAEKWKKLGEFDSGMENDSLEWAPDESHFAWSWRKNQVYGMDLRADNTKMIKSWNIRDLTPGFTASARIASFRYLDSNRLFISAHAIIKGLGRGAVGVLLDPKTGTTVRHFFELSSGTFHPFGTTSTDGKFAATTTEKGLEAVIYSLADGKVVARCGSRTPVPTTVAWSKDVKSPAIAWTDDAAKKPWASKPEDMRYSFDLAKLEPATKVDPAAFVDRRLEIGDWKLAYGDTAHNYLQVHLKHAAKDVFELVQPSAMTLIQNGDQPPLVAQSTHDQFTGMGSFADVRDATGKVLTNLLPTATHIRDMVSSSDGRYLLISTGTHRLSIYRTNGSQFPFLNLVQANGEWVCWTAEGYYAASPGGEKMIGWAENKGPNEFPLFHPVDRFAKQFHRPDIIKLAFEKGSVAEAVEALKAELPEVETILPPTAKLELVEQRGGNVKVKATATASKPILAMRILHNGRPLKNGQGVWEPVEGKVAEGVFEIQIEGGLSELKVLARTEDGSNASEPLLIRTPKDSKNQPTIHRICIGINDYDESSLKLGSAAKDAEMAYEAFDKYCVGADNRFSSAKGELILNKDATHERVINAIRKTRDEVKLGDLVVIFFAGHGIKQNLPKDPKKPEEIEEKFFLLTREGNPANALTGKSVSGDELSAELAPMICPVLLIFDACHTSAATKSFSPATDAMTRKVTDPDVGVTVLCAAMSRETAGATTENGHFTAGLLKALKLGADVPYDPYEKQLYVHHIYSVVYSEVRRATNGKQNPFLNMPWTMPPLPIRDVPVK